MDSPRPRRLLLSAALVTVFIDAALAADWEQTRAMHWPLATALLLTSTLGMVLVVAAMAPPPPRSPGPPELTPFEQVQTFTASVSHDLRTPLRAIDGFARELQLDTDSSLSPRAVGYVERIRAAATRMNAIIDALLELSTATRRPLRRRPIDLSTMAHAVIAEVNDPARSIDFDVQEDLRASGDPHMVRIVLDNLFDNAVKFTSRSAAANISFGTAVAGAGLAYFVKDNGVGFDSRSAAALFVPFQRLHSTSEFEGSGVGLATVERIVQRHGGRIWAESTPGKGATFYFTLGDSEEAAS